ncbi:MAG: ABC transporter permease [Bifidobacteriaceae bacterium]|jgi:putative ABC transport system permease protein|nr:ABC transporter permease [Bifidobacteriaceae bacterium]
MRNPFGKRPGGADSGQTGAHGAAQPLSPAPGPGESSDSRAGAHGAAQDLAAMLRPGDGPARTAGADDPTQVLPVVAGETRLSGIVQKRRRRLRPMDVLATATLGPRTRLMRAALSALGIAIGIAALVALQGIPASQQAEFRAELDRQGANLIVVYPGHESQDPNSAAIPLPDTAPAMVGRIAPVEAVLARRDLVDVLVYRNSMIPAGQSGSISAAMADGDLLGTLNVELAEGRWFDAASRTLPTVVLGDGAARRLGVGVGARIWIDNRWWAVIGVLERMNLAQEMDSTAFLAPDYAGGLYPDVELASIYVAAAHGKAGAVRSVMAATVNPANPRGVEVTGLSDWAAAGQMVDDMFRTLSLGLGALALLIGGIGIANTMVVAVMERRGEVGLRRAMGARTGQIALQFVLEAAFIGFAGGVLGVGLGAYATYLYTSVGDMAFAIPWWVIAAGPAISVVVGALAGLYPSLKAARLSPTVALRAI